MEPVHANQASVHKAVACLVPVPHALLGGAVADTAIATAPATHLAVQKLLL